jgi:hypothetical protein
MINFRYHLVSIIAVLLALAVGIVAGSGFLGGPILKVLRNQVALVRDSNASLRQTLSERKEALDRYESFADEAERRLVRNALRAEAVVVCDVDGTNTVMLEGLRSSIEEAGGRISTTMTLADKLRLTTAEERAGLSDLLGSAARSPRELRARLGTVLGTRAAAAASPSVQSRLGPTVDDRLRGLAEQLQAGGYLRIEPSVGELVPDGALFLIALGSPEEPPFDAQPLVRELGIALSARGAGVLVAEPTDSAWGIVQSIRADGEASEVVSTVDQAETVPGQVATALGLDLAASGRAGHWGVQQGAAAVIPEPAALAG